MGKVESFIIKQIIKEQYVLTIHARKRMNERFLTDDDIVKVAQTVKAIIRQESNNTYLLKGKSVWGEKVSMSVALRDNLIIVTIFFEEEK